MPRPARKLPHNPPPSLAATLGESPHLPATSPSPAGTIRGAAVFTGHHTNRPALIIAQPHHLKFMMHLQSKYSNNLGFIPQAGLYEYVASRRVGIALENGEPAGYVLGRESYKYQRLLRPITQAAVAMDAQRRHHGMALVTRVADHARNAGQLAVQAICAEDLDANDFWAALGFLPVCAMAPDNARGRQLIVWRKPLTDKPPTWFYTPPPGPIAANRKHRRTT